jgi:ribonuclease VapC
LIRDTSVVIAILLNEPDAALFAAAVAGADSCAISAANFLEVSMVVEE